MIGKSIAQYRIVEELGRGGMGMVYKALDTQLDRPVVLKLLMRDRLSDDAARRRFLREARLASALDHPNICTIYEIQEADGYYFIAMQFVEGETLKEAINSRPLPLQTVISIALQIADALAAAHGRGIIHRDIKPQNIMLTPRGQVKILDFGLAKNLDDADSSHGTDLTELGSPLGTPSYMSPEQIDGERVDRRSDIFSFGIVLFEMITGRKPFVEKNRIDLLHAIRREPAPPLAHFTPSAPPPLQAIVERAMTKHPADRYQTVDDLLADLKRLAVAANAEPEIPDGIARPYVPVVRDPWWKRAWMRALGRLQPDAASITSSHLAGLVLEAPEVAPAVDDFPIISGPHKTLAVLPFRSLGGATDAAWSLSLLDTLVAQLSVFKSLSIRPSSYVRHYLDLEIDPAEVGRELRADAVLLGSYIRAADTMRVTTQLIDVETGGILWAGKVDAGNVDEMRLQDDICERLVSRLSGIEKARSAVELLRDESEELRLDALLTLKYSRDPRAIDVLVEALSDVSPRVQAAASDALARFGRLSVQAVRQELEESLHAGRTKTARFAARTAGLLGSAELLPSLLEALVSKDPLLAAEAALALGRLRDQRARPDLEDALTHPDANVRFSSVQALGLLADPDALPALEIMMRTDDDEGVRAKALWAIMRIRRTLLVPKLTETGRLRAEAAS